MKNKKWIGILCATTLAIQSPMITLAGSDFSEDTETGNVYMVSLVNSGETISAKQEIYGIQNYDVPENIREIGEASVQKYLNINDMLVALYPEFDDTSEALKNAREAYTNMIELLQSYYQLEELSEENWQEYRACMWKYLDEDDKSEWYTEDSDMFAALDTFFDVYENAEQNLTIITIANSADSVESLLYDTAFAYLLPWNVAEEYVNELAKAADIISPMQETAKTNLSDTSAAITYAETYAVSPNSSYEYISGADCTNFASQIMVAGGNSTNSNWRAYKILSTWHYTSSWSNANAFVNYWGLYATYTSHSSFASNLSKGSFITEDKSNDGDWDHMGFVVELGGYASTGYRDYKVAQHTSDYLAWASSSTCGWDTLSTNYPNVVYGRVKS